MASSIVNFGWLFYRAITEYYCAITVQLENNCTATNGKIYTGYAIRVFIAYVCTPSELQKILLGNFLDCIGSS